MEGYIETCIVSYHASLLDSVSLIGDCIILTAESRIECSIEIFLLQLYMMFI